MKSLSLIRGASVALAAASCLVGGLVTAPAATAGEEAARLAPDTLVSSTGKVLTTQDASRLVPAGATHGFSGSRGQAVPTSHDARSRRSIIGTDDRVRVTPTNTYPARATVLINRSGSLHCTGWMVSRDTLLTAGHCVHTGGSSGSWYTNLSFRPGSDGNTAPYGTCLSRGTWAFNGWLNSGDSRYDGAIIKLNCTVGDTVGWYGMWWQTASLNGLSTTVEGYPGDKSSQQWLSRDFVRATETERLYYQNDTVGGMSGSPIYQVRPAGSAFCAGVCSMGIHTNGGTTNNSGMRLTQAKFNSIVALINTP